jgi:hypothetical protein
MIRVSMAGSVNRPFTLADAGISREIVTASAAGELSVRCVK